MANVLYANTFVMGFLNILNSDGLDVELVRMGE